MNEKTKEFLKDSLALLLVILLFILSSLFIQQNSDWVRESITSTGYLGIVIYLLALIVSIVFPLFNVIFLMPIAANAWGIVYSASIAVIGWTLGSLIAFIIAKKYGKPLVQKLISLKKLEKIERLIPEGNIFFLIIFLTAIMPLDGLAYFLGLFTKIRIKTFTLATFIGLIPFCFLFAYLGTLPLIYQLIGFVLAVIVIILTLLYLDKKYKKKLGKKQASKKTNKTKK